MKPPEYLECVDPYKIVLTHNYHASNFDYVGKDERYQSVLMNLFYSI